MHKIVAVVKRIIYSPWPYIVVVPPLAFYVGILLSNGLWNGWAGFVVALLTTVAIAWLGRHPYCHGTTSYWVQRILVHSERTNNSGSQ